MKVELSPLWSIVNVTNWKELFLFLIILTFSLTTPILKRPGEKSLLLNVLNYYLSWKYRSSSGTTGGNSRASSCSSNCCSALSGSSSSRAAYLCTGRENHRDSGREEGAVSDRENYTSARGKAGANNYRKARACSNRGTISDSYTSLQTYFPSENEEIPPSSSILKKVL